MYIVLYVCNYGPATGQRGQDIGHLCSQSATVRYIYMCSAMIVQELLPTVLTAIVYNYLYTVVYVVILFVNTRNPMYCT